MKTYKTVSMTEAENRGYSAITSEFNRDEHDLLDNVIRDMQGCAYLLVQNSMGIAVYRKKSDLNVWQDHARYH
jgi:hypothetical protein